ncbi:AraC family transcriptional regulator [Luteibacter aegosomaticola]|uniref:helix-turn-helix domain-containing protein n=1 Tax=Luteibacter aegosomaticola TaxID=2911538 RepID=UPI001FF8A4F0|nr:AraC family transcriptional regulator [Luteibacter aegosomaticola]UPG88126.1 AraC family transcriptional regulator [Luteibacter aegosomaticola]
MPSGVYGPLLGRAYGQPAALFRASTTHGGHTLAATSLRHEQHGFGLSEPHAAADAFMVVVQLRALARHELRMDGQTIYAGAIEAGSTCLVDLTAHPQAYFADPFEAMHFFIPREALREFSDEACREPITRLVPPGEVFVADHVTRAIAECMHRQLIDGYADDRLLVDHALLALRAHVAVRYGGGQLIQPRTRLGLAPWQRRRAQELLHAHISDGISLKDLARECCLSESGLLRAFTTTMGTSPHRWLSTRRIELAMELIRGTDRPLADIAVATGFADQAHFTRVFGKHVGVSPGAWRRQVARGPVEEAAA